MWTRSGKTNQLGTSCGRGQSNPSKPPRELTIKNTLATLVSASTVNACILQALAQHVIPDPEADSTYLDFLKTQPPIFYKANEPLEPEDWLRTIEQKFSLIRCSDVPKTQFVVQQLQGPAGAWWANFISTRPEGQVSWDNFCTGFLTRFIPYGIRRVKVEEFYKLKQGEDQRVMEYLEKFNQLCQYAAERVWNDEEKKRCFVRGLYSEIQRMLVTIMDDSYDKIVSIAIAADDANQADLEDKKRKCMQEESSGSNFWCLKIVYQPVHHSLYLPP
jgi:hypothetical protein